MKNWWDALDSSKFGTKQSFEQTADFRLLFEATTNNKCVYRYRYDGNLTIDFNSLLKDLGELGGRAIAKSYGTDTIMNPKEHLFVWEDGFMSVSLEGDDYLYISIASLNEELVKSATVIAKKHLEKKTQGKVYVFVSSMDGAELRQVSGEAGVELERGNYTPEVLADYDHIVKDIERKSPCGRISILSGQAGSGKTHLIRGITSAVKNAMFVLVPASMIEQITSPSFLPVLMDNNREGQPVVFIIEDADSCLVARGGDNMGSISGLLNLGDGIFGSMFSFKLVATTNSKRIDIDKAIMRKGRICRYVEVEGLNGDQANKVFERLVRKETTLFSTTNNNTLADIYSAARDAGWNSDGQEEVKEYKEPSVKIKRGRMGF